VGARGGVRIQTVAETDSSTQNTAIDPRSLAGDDDAAPRGHQYEEYKTPNDFQDKGGVKAQTELGPSARFGCRGIWTTSCWVRL